MNATIVSVTKSNTNVDCLSFNQAVSTEIIALLFCRHKYI